MNYQQTVVPNLTAGSCTHREDLHYLLLPTVGEPSLALLQPGCAEAVTLHVVLLQSEAGTGQS